VIVAAKVTQETTDSRQLLPMLDQVKREHGPQPAGGQCRCRLLERGQCDG
jgi:hypothetical protein